MFQIKEIIKEFIQYATGAMFLWLLSAAYKVMREVRDGRKDAHKKRNSRRMSKVDGKKLPTKHRNSIGLKDSNQESHKNDIKKPRKTKKKRKHTLEIPLGCWAVLFFPMTLAITSAFLPLHEYMSLFDEVWVRHQAHKFKIIFHEMVYRDPLSPFDWTGHNQSIKEPFTEETHLSSLSPQTVKIGKRKIEPQEQQKRKKSRSNARVFVVDDLLTKAECDKLSWIHNSHVWSMSTYEPVTCFDSDTTMNDYMLKVPRTQMLSTPIPGTMCINITIPGIASKTIYTSEFFRGESKFSLDLADRIEKTLGLHQSHGHGFTITSLSTNPEPNVLNNNKGCLEESQSGQLRRTFGSILLFLSDVGDGDHVSFTDLGIKIEPKKGRAIAWTSQSTEGHCDRDVSYDITPPEKGTLYTLQQWFYPEQFPGIGRRSPEPDVPFRKPSQPYVYCDKVRCQWFDNWKHFAHRIW